MFKLIASEQGYENAIPTSAENVHNTPKPISGQAFFSLPQGSFHGKPRALPTGTWRGIIIMKPASLPSGTWRVKLKQMPKGIWFSSRIDSFDTANGHSYTFSFVETSDGFEIDIFSMPSYGNRENNLEATHRMPSSRPNCQHRICREPNPKTMSEAYAVAENWAGRTDNYILFGENF